MRELASTACGKTVSFLAGNGGMGYWDYYWAFPTKNQTENDITAATEKQQPLSDWISTCWCTTDRTFLGFWLVIVSGGPCYQNKPQEPHQHQTILGGSWVVISGVISPLIWVISIVILHIALLITTHEPPNKGLSLDSPLLRQPEGIRSARESQRRN